MRAPSLPSHLEFEQALAASVRALSGDKQAQFNVASIPGNKTSFAQLKVMRGMADREALMLRYHSSKIHQQLRPSATPASEIFDKAEQMRVEALGGRGMQGVADNLASVLEHHALISGYNHITGHETVPIADIVALLLRETLTGLPAPALAAPLMQKYGAWVKSRITKELASLGKKLENQAEFSDMVLTLISQLEGREEGKGEQPPVPAPEEEAALADNNTSTEQESVQAVSMAESASAKLEALAQSSLSEAVASDEMSETEVDATDQPASEAYPFVEERLYRAYTREFDETIPAEKLASAEELTRLRLQLDNKLEQLQHITSRLAHRLQRKLIARQRRSWELNQEEGIIDNAKLATVIADPAYPLYYKWEKQHEQFHTVVTLLLDNSGSMRGRPITIAAMSADILARTLERCGIKVEILGFTTCEWKGGKSRKQWLENGKPPTPGRLNDLRHIIYKAADSPWRRSKKNLGLMLKEGILKENIDGEAILFAYERLLQRPEQRRILMVISDGAPVDDSTASSNDGNYLENHLRSVIQMVEKSGAVELLAIGIGHDVGRYYQHAVTIREVDSLTDTMFGELSELL